MPGLSDLSDIQGLAGGINPAATNALQSNGWGRDLSPPGKDGSLLQPSLLESLNLGNNSNNKGGMCLQDRPAGEAHHCAA